QDYWGDLTFAFADMGLQPNRNEPRQLRRKRSGPARQGTADHNEAGDGDDSYEERSQPQRINSPVGHSQCERPHPFRLGRPSCLYLKVYRSTVTHLSGVSPAPGDQQHGKIIRNTSPPRYRGGCSFGSLADMFGWMKKRPLYP